LIDNYKNISYFGKFQNPDHLPNIYECIDLSIGTYDVTSDNVKYAEPNKLYESIYFRVPIIVSSDTFLNNKVQELGIGVGINALNENSIIEFVNNLNINQIQDWRFNIEQIDEDFCINYNTSFFEKLQNKKIKI